MPSDLYDAGPTDRRPPFRFSAQARVWFSDTDAQGVVYYGRYLPYFDHARLEYHRHLGLESLWHGDHEFVMRAMTVEYEAPAVFDDLLEVFVRTTRIGRTSATVRVRRLPRRRRRPDVHGGPDGRPHRRADAPADGDPGRATGRRSTASRAVRRRARR